ncbi:hypothetical protein GF348_09775, partial [candidate division KSB3 bacterium]|nr:hypothetical protein [candidate division KSB3 bacterium]
MLLLVGLVLGWIAVGLMLIIGLLLVLPIKSIVQRKISLRKRQKQQQARAMTDQAESAYDEATFTSWHTWPVDAGTKADIEAYRKRQAQGEEIVIGHIDGDGRVLSLFGTLPGFDVIGEDVFVERPRCRIDIVLIDGNVLIRKNFLGDREAFVEEWYNLVLLYGKANVPAIHHVDEEDCILYKNLISGRTLNDLLVDAGAKIRDSQTQDDPLLQSLSRAERLRAILNRGTQRIDTCLSEEFLCALEQQMD